MSDRWTVTAEGYRHVLEGMSDVEIWARHERWARWVEEAEDRTLWGNYTKLAARTAIYPPENARLYLLAGLQAEIGELWGLIASKARGDPAATEQGAAIVSELGDIAWMLAMSLKEWDMMALERQVPELAQMGRRRTVPGEAIAAVFLNGLTRAANMAVSAWHADDHKSTRYALNGAVVQYIEVLQAFGLSVEEVAASNIRKLYRRLRDGAIRKGEKRQ
jgi:hypothetical protein